MGRSLFLPELPSPAAGSRSINRVLIANRGEISCRVIRTCRLLGLTSISIYTDEDAQSRHVAEADTAINLGSIDQDHGNPFLNIELIVGIAKQTGADAVHPGYGYLSENTAFAEAVREAGIVFLGPSAHAILTLGDKRQSKEYLRENCPSVPLIPGFTGRSQELSKLAMAADEIGYPVMLKASAGGGGKGIRIIRAKEELESNLERAQSEAQRSFGSSDCILEKYIEAGKHVEVQIIGDTHGNVVSLFERECSVQRRHQKIIEESPCTWLSPDMRSAMCEAACSIGRLVKYEGVGTVEFIVDVNSSSFYFLEVNSRIQVEHPITEEVTGVDIVGLQLFVAAGGWLSDLELANVTQTGHAIECRLCAENPQQGFLPELGTIHLWKPSSLEYARFETAITSGTELTMSFDPMISKIIVWAPDRASAIQKMVSVLADTACIGLTTNQLFLQSCLLHPAFRDPAYTTLFIENNLESLLEHPYSHILDTLSFELVAIPATFLKDSASGPTSFRNITKRFRNQSQDKSNHRKMIVSTIPNKSFPSNIKLDSPQLLTWASDERQRSSEESLYQIPLTPVFDAERLSPVFPNLTGPQRLSRLYNAVSNLLRGHTVSERLETHVKTVSGKTLPEESKPYGHSFVEVNAELNQRLISGILVVLNDRYLSGVSSDTGRPRRILFHAPILGTWVSFEIFDLLSYFESLRSHAATDAENRACGWVEAPMPCKVLRILKNSGEDVNKGEAVLVVESMKMEMSITVPINGKLKCSLSEGQSVREGEVLCSVE